MGDLEMKSFKNVLRNKRRFAAIAVLCLFVLCTGTAFAASDPISLGNRSWLQATKPEEIIDLGELQPGDQQQVYIEGSMYSAASGSYTVKLQKHGFWPNQWEDNVNIYTGTQGPGNGAKGVPFRYYWHINSKGKYRVSFTVDKNPQAAVIYNIKYNTK